MSQASPQTPIPATVPNLERKALALLLLVAALFMGFVLFVMHARGVFTASQALILIADDSEGVSVGMDLTFSGFPIGRIRRIELGASGKARLLVDIPQEDAHWLRTSSIFTMERGLVGDTRIRAYSGILSDPPLPPGAERNLLRGDTAAEIPKLVAATRELLDNLGRMSAPQSSINTSLDNVQAITQRLSGQYGLMGGMLGSDANAKKIITTIDRTNSLLGKTDQRVFGKDGVMDSTQAALSEAQATLKQSQLSVRELHAMLQDARNTLARVDAVLAEAQAVGANVRVASTDLGALRAEVEDSLRKIGQLTNEVTQKWPFARDTEIKLP